MELRLGKGLAPSAGRWVRVRVRVWVRCTRTSAHRHTGRSGPPTAPQAQAAPQGMATRGAVRGAEASVGSAAGKGR